MERDIVLFNDSWWFACSDKRSYARVRCEERLFERVTLPHNNSRLPLNYFAESETQRVCWYRKRFRLPAKFSARRIFVDFDGVMMSAEVFVDGRRAATHRGGYVPFSVDITNFLRPGVVGAHTLAVRVDSRLQSGVPPCGHVMDYLPFGGIYRDVRLRAVPEVFIEDVVVRPSEVLSPAKRLAADVTVRNSTSGSRSVQLALDLMTPAGKLLRSGDPVAVEIVAGRSAIAQLELRNLRGITLWDVNSPALYMARATLCAGGKKSDRVSVRFGFREALFSREGPFYLNGRQLKLVGLNRHQTYPYIGAAAPARLQRRDADILRHELGCNMVRTSHYPQSPHFLDRCDEIGLMVLEEIPGWGHIGNAAWKKLACRDLREMIIRDRNHPSVVLWGVRINESPDDHDFYMETNRLAHELDPTRPTGGVRRSQAKMSEFLEDVYTANDFIYQADKLDESRVIREPHALPYLITEFGGSHADSRVTDGMPVHVRQAIVHARVLDAAFGHPKIAGALGWCAFDHHSQDWITADGLQPFGVADVFRFPKFVAALYASQKPPGVQPVLRAVTRWRVGDMAGFDPATAQVSASPAAFMLVFSNCDRIEIYVGNEKRGDFAPARDYFPHLPHPPFLCKGIGAVWGPSWRELRLVGYVGKKAVAEQRFAADNGPTNLVVQTDDKELVADGSDMTRLSACHADRYGNPQVFSRATVSFKISGPASIVGSNPCALSGGMAAVYVKAGLKPGVAEITARAEGLPERKIRLRIRARAK